MLRKYLAQTFPEKVEKVETRVEKKKQLTSSQFAWKFSGLEAFCLWFLEFESWLLLLMAGLENLDAVMLKSCPAAFRASTKLTCFAKLDIVGRQR